MPSFDTTIAVSANQSGLGQPVDFDGPVAGAITLTNTSPVSVQYATDGVTWVTVAAAGAATFSAPDQALFRVRKVASDSYPVAVRFQWQQSDGQPQTIFAAAAQVAEAKAAGTPYAAGTVVIGPDGSVLGVVDGSGNLGGVAGVFDSTQGRPVLSMYPPSLQVPPWRALQVANPFAAPVVPFGTALINEIISTGSSGNSSAIDTAITFAGRPTTKVTLGGAPSTQIMEIGITAATFTPATLARSMLTNHVVCAFKSQVSIAAASLYVGDASYTNFYVVIMSVLATTSDGWTIMIADPAEAGILSTTGTPNITGAVRCKLRLTTTSGNQPTGDTWFGFAGVAARTKGRLILTFDDGYDEHYSFLYPALKARGLPASFSIDGGVANTAGFMTTAQLTTIASDPSGLFELTNHGANNQSFAGVGLSAYLANIATTNTFLTSVGAPAKSRNLHVFVQGSFDQTLIDAMQALGYRSMREVGASNRSVWPLLANVNTTESNVNSYFSLPASCNLENTQSVATVIGYVETAKAAGRTFVVMGHKFEAASGTITWIAGYDSTAGMLNFLDYLAAERDAGRLDILKWSDLMDLQATGLAVM